MHKQDRKFLNKDGSFDLEAAVAAGRNARAQDLSEGCGIVRDAAVQLASIAWRAAAVLSSRISSSRVFPSKAA